MATISAALHVGRLMAHYCPSAACAASHRYGANPAPQVAYDPEWSFPESGPDYEAMALLRQNAPGAPTRAGTCMVAIVCTLDRDGSPARYVARAQGCGREGRPHTGTAALLLAERDASHLDGHQCGTTRPAG